MAEIIRITDLGSGISRLGMDDPAEENRLSDRMCRELLAALDALSADPALKVVVLTGRSDVFCAGGTLEMLRQIASGEVAARDLLLPERLLAFPLPIVGALEGHAVGGGLTLALCCDVLVAAEEKRYGANFASMGFTPGMGTTALLPALVGHQLASEMMLTSAFYKGRELRGRSLFNHVVPGREVLDRAVDLARRMAEKPRYVLAGIKETLALPRRRTLADAMSREHLLHAMCFSQPETAAILEANYLSGASRRDPAPPRTDKEPL